MAKRKKTNRAYSKEFKLEALARSKEIGSPKTCKELGISSSTLFTWKKQLSNTDQSGNTKPSYLDLEKEVKRLKKEIGYINEINRVLKKSTAIFSSKELGGLK